MPKIVKSESSSSTGVVSPSGSFASTASLSSPSLEQISPQTPQSAEFPNFSTFDPLGFSFEGFTQIPKDFQLPSTHHHHQLPSSSENPGSPHDYYGADALVPSFFTKEVILKPVERPFIPPSFNLRKEGHRLIYICSATDSFATLLGRSHREIEGLAFRDILPRGLYKSCLMTWFQTYSQERAKGHPVVSFQLPCILVGSAALIPVELTSIIAENSMGDIAVIRMDVREISTAEALAAGLPLFDPNIDNDTGDMPEDEKDACCPPGECDEDGCDDDCENGTHG